jgi:hypothetical protein
LVRNRLRELRRHDELRGLAEGESRLLRVDTLALVLGLAGVV